MMLTLLMCLVLDFKTPIDYYYSEPKKIGTSQPVNRKQRRGIK